MPEFYTLIKIAQYLGVKPWELMEQSFYWLEAGLLATEIDNLIEEDRYKKQQR